MCAFGDNSIISVTARPVLYVDIFRFGLTGRIRTDFSARYITRKRRKRSTVRNLQIALARSRSADRTSPHLSGVNIADPDYGGGMGGSHFGLLVCIGILFFGGRGGRVVRYSADFFRSVSRRRFK